MLDGDTADTATRAGGRGNAGLGVARRRGRAGCEAPVGVHVGLGATKAQVTAAYPNLVEGINGSHAPVPGNARADQSCSN
ncbi:hypothetical protein [Amycolatopsis samaneae]|uniref:Uncharacterized protein n=1 Tax=Amycolatopsis samaneae TaxID=664691 RepID=A0ABW5GH63_9PSEU